jgi:hypothetical protein
LRRGLAERDKLKDIAQDANGSRDERIGCQTVELSLGAGAGGEEAVGDGLGIEVGKLLLG